MKKTGKWVVDRGHGSHSVPGLNQHSTAGQHSYGEFQSGFSMQVCDDVDRVQAAQFWAGYSSY